MRPLVFIHNGNQKYLQTAIKQSKKFNSFIFLIGDTSNQKYCDNWVSGESLITPSYYSFVEKFENLSSNSYEFELGCFRRYFVLQQFMEKNGFSEVVTVDSDLLVFADLCNFDFGSVDIACDWTLSGDCASPQCLYITKETLDKFIEFLPYFYTEKKDILLKKWNYHVQNNVPGGICDMTLLYHFLMNTDLKKLNLFEYTKYGVFDDNLSETDGGRYKTENYLHKWTLKKIIKSKEGYCFITQDNRTIPVLTMHCQGIKKCLMKSISCGKVNAFEFNRNIFYTVYIKRFFKLANYKKVFNSSFWRRILKK